MNISSNGVPLINGVEYGWADVVLAINGVPVSGITAISYGEKQDVANIYDIAAVLGDVILFQIGLVLVEVVLCLLDFLAREKADMAQFAICKRIYDRTT